MTISIRTALKYLYPEPPKKFKVRLTSNELVRLGACQRGLGRFEDNVSKLKKSFKPHELIPLSRQNDISWLLDCVKCGRLITMEYFFALRVRHGLHKKSPTEFQLMQDILDYVRKGKWTDKVEADLVRRVDELNSDTPTQMRWAISGILELQDIYAYDYDPDLLQAIVKARVERR